MISYLRSHQLFLFSLFIIYFSIIIFFYRLGSLPLSSGLEAWYGELTRNMLRGGSLTVFSWNGEFFYHASPLLVWISGLGVSLFGVSEFSFRFFPAFFSLLSVLIVSFFSFKRWGLFPGLGAYFSLILSHQFVSFSRNMGLESLLSLWFVLFFIAFFYAKRYRYFILGGLGALIYFSFSFAVFLPVLFVGLEWFWKRREEIYDYFTFSLILFIPIFSYLLLGLFSIGFRFLAHLFFVPIGFGGGQFLFSFLPFWALFIGMLLFSVVTLVKQSGLSRSAFFLTVTGLGSFLVFYQLYTSSIVPILYQRGNFSVVESATFLRTYSYLYQEVVRLDGDFAQAVYYSDRKVYSTDNELNSFGGTFLSEEELRGKLFLGEVDWVVGKKEEIDRFLDQVSDIPFRKVTLLGDEVILEKL